MLERIHQPQGARRDDSLPHTNPTRKRGHRHALASLARFEVAHFEDDRDATLKIGGELKPEAQAKPFSSKRASLALQASIAGLSADLSSNSATSKLTLGVTW